MLVESSAGDPRLGDVPAEGEIDRQTEGRLTVAHVELDLTRNGVLLIVQRGQWSNRQAAFVRRAISSDELNGIASGVKTRSLSAGARTHVEPELDVPAHGPQLPVHAIRVTASPLNRNLQRPAHRTLRTGILRTGIFRTSIFRTSILPTGIDRTRVA